MEVIACTYENVIMKPIKNCKKKKGRGGGRGRKRRDKKE
jgi:hypothetical protein